MKIARPQPTFASLEQRLANQTRRLNQGVRAGTLTEAEAAPLRQRLSAAQVGLEADRFDGNGLTQRAAASQLLNGISADLQAATRNETMDTGKALTNLEARLRAGTTDGTLTKAEQRHLSEKLSTLEKSLSGATTPEARQAAQAELRAVSQQLFRARHDGQFNANTRLDHFQARIDAGLADGSLTATEASRMQEQVKALETLKGLGVKSGVAFNAVSRSIFSQRHDAQTDVDLRAASIGARLDRALQSGRLTAEQAASFKSALSSLSADGAVAAGPRLNVLEQQLTSTLQASV